MKRILGIILVLVMVVGVCAGCDNAATSGSKLDQKNTIENANKLQSNQPTPTDITTLLRDIISSEEPIG